jgi:flagellin
MVINTNVSAQSSARLLAESSDRLTKSLNRLSSGSKIVSPEDDAGGMAVSMRFDAQINRVDAANKNVGNAISYLQTKDGFLQKVGKALDRMSELATLSLDMTKTDGDRALYNQEFQQLSKYMQEVGNKDFNGVSLFNDASYSVTTDSEGTMFTPDAVVVVGQASYSAAYGSSVNSTASATTALSAVTGAITKLAQDRANVGASIVRLNSTSSQLSVLKDNLSAANSRIKDVDVADESTQFARYNILVQAGTAMLAQANSTPQSALRLLG